MAATDVNYVDHQAYRYSDHPRPGSIYRLPDIPQLVRGPTLVLLPSGKEIKVPRMARREIQANADIHAAAEHWETPRVAENVGRKTRTCCTDRI